MVIWNASLLHSSQNTEGSSLQSLDEGALNSPDKPGSRTWRWSVHLKELFLVGTHFTKHLLSNSPVSEGESSGNGDKFITPKL